MALQVVSSSPTLSKSGSVYWIGADGNVWYKAADGTVTNMGPASGTSTTANLTLNGSKEIADPLPGGTTTASAPTSGGGGGGGTAAAAAPVDPDIAMRAALRGEIKGRGGEIDAAYASLFGDLDNLLRSRDMELETQYGDQLRKAGEQYSGALPQIETSYAAIGSADSTDKSDAKTGAKKGFDETTKTIGSNKAGDKAKLGQYGSENRAKFTADKEAASRNVARADSTEDVGALRQMRNDLESNLSQTGVTRATLGSDGKARADLSALTADSGRYEAAIGALDSILKSSMSGAVKEAAVQAITTSAGLSDEEKKKVQQTYGNVYAEQAAL